MNISDTVFAVIDTETTGVDFEKDKVCEVGCLLTSITEPGAYWGSLVNPGIEIPPVASAVHHLTDEDVADAPYLSDALLSLGQFFARESTGEEPIAHNAAFDAQFLYGKGETWLCTMRLAKHIWSDAPGYKNQVLRYWRKLKVDLRGALPHRTEADCLVTGAILRDLLTCEEFKRFEISTIEELHELSASPIRISRWPFGKYYDQPIAAARGDESYIRWCLDKNDRVKNDPDLRFTLQRGLVEGLFR